MNLKFFKPPPTQTLNERTKDLLTAVLRNPIQLPECIKSLDETRLGFCGEDGNVIIECVNQYNRSGTYNTRTIEHATKRTDLIIISTRPIDADLGFYVDVWNEEYKNWALCTAMEHALHEIKTTGIAKDGENIYSQICSLLRYDADLLQEDWRSEFTEYTERKIHNLMPDLKTKNFVPGWRDTVPEFAPGTVTVIAARPGMGKTHLLLDVVSGFDQQGAKGVVYTLEMPGSQMARRLLARKALVNHRADWSTLKPEKIELIRNCVKDITAAGFDFVTSVNLSQLIADARLRSKRGELDYLFIDHIGLLMLARIEYNDVKRISDITRTLKSLSMELKIPVIELSQLSRSVESRGGSKRPMLSDLRDSGTIEQDADIVSFIYRPEYYGITEDETGQSTVGIAEIITAKFRDGGTDTSMVGYHPIKGFYCTEDEMRGGEQAKILAQSNNHNPNASQNYSDSEWSGLTNQTSNAARNSDEFLNDIPF